MDKRGHHISANDTNRLFPFSNKIVWYLYCTWMSWKSLRNGHQYLNVRTLSSLFDGNEFLRCVSCLHQMLFNFVCRPSAEWDRALFQRQVVCYSSIVENWLEAKIFINSTMTTNFCFLFFVRHRWNSNDDKNDNNNSSTDSVDDSYTDINTWNNCQKIVNV